ncbi:hypothetical protein Q7P37_004422 [Cladosporium fusiforme]
MQTSHHPHTHDNTMSHAHTTIHHKTHTCPRCRPPASQPPFGLLTRADISNNDSPPNDSSLAQCSTMTTQEPFTTQVSLGIWRCDLHHQISRHRPPVPAAAHFYTRARQIGLSDGKSRGPAVTVILFNALFSLLLLGCVITVTVGLHRYTKHSHTLSMRLSSLSIHGHIRIDVKHLDKKAARSAADETSPTSFQIEFINNTDSDNVHAYVVTNSRDSDQAVLITAGGEVYKPVAYSKGVATSIPKDANCGIPLGARGSKLTISLPVDMLEGRICGLKRGFGGAPNAWPEAPTTLPRGK